MIKIAAALILYNPDEKVINNFKSYYDYVDELFVFDNTESTSLESRFYDLPKVSYYHNYQNDGIAKQLNLACELAMQNEFDWILTMDQDTSFSNENIESYFKCFNEFKNKENIAAFGTNFKTNSHDTSNSCLFKYVDRLITSGMLVNLATYKSIGGFDEALFIDLVDDDYCIAAKKNGFNIVQFTNIIINHNLGTAVYRSSIKSFFLIKKKKEIHAPLRCYYMYRNLLYLETKYKGLHLKQVPYLRKIITSHLKVCLLYGRNSLDIIRYLIKAKRDFNKRSFGKFKPDA